MPGRLYVVATPIGNLEDITLRALRVLKEVNCIAAEDTRHSKKLLSHYDIRTPLVSYHDHNEKSSAPRLVQRLLAGETIALVSDAGTPGVSDPGYRLITAAAAAGIEVTPVPGPSALTAALSVAALPLERFVFEGFLPEKTEQRRERLRLLHDEPRTLVFYEAPHRIEETLEDMEIIFGQRQAAIARELSKIHEAVLRGPVGELRAQLAGGARGEIVLIVAGSPGKAPAADERVQAEIRRLRRGGMRVKEIAELLSVEYGRPKKEIYRRALEIENEMD
jgi:16S rRNA (cytidine1402-2'-O)-methyltransferase